MAYNNTNNPAEPDRRSAVSSFYGGRRTPSFDALATADVRAPASPPPHGSTARPALPGAGASYSPRPPLAPAQRDSFFGDAQRGGAGAGAGYNRASFFDAGRAAPVKGARDDDGDDDVPLGGAFGGGGGGGFGRAPPPGAGGVLESKGQGQGAGQSADDGWDVYADFNNLGPRYSSAFVKYDEGYQRLPPDTQSAHNAPVASKIEVDSTGAPVELVTVPALGAEWKRSELEAMTKKGRSEGRSYARWRKVRMWTRDQRGLCGKWGTRKQIAIGMFITAVILGLVLGFTIPRVPAFAFASPPLRNSTTLPDDTLFARVPANFTFNADLHLQVDTGGSFVPIRFSRFHVDLFDLQTARQVAEGDLRGKVVPGKSFQEMQVPMNFTYVASNTSDQTWTNWYNACRNAGNYPNGERPGLAFRIVLKMNIVGLIGSRQASTQVSNTDCPVELALNAA